SFDFHAEIAPESVIWRPYHGVPGILARHDGTYEAAPDWYRGFVYCLEKERGLDCVEDLATPGVFRFDLSRGQGLLRLSLADDADASGPPAVDASSGPIEPPEGGGVPRSSGPPVLLRLAQQARAAERARRGAFASRLHRSGDAYLTRRGEGCTVIAGYPWFTD